MKILQINKFFYRRRGAETYLFDLSDLLRQHGHTVAEFAMQHPENELSPWSQYFVDNVDYNSATGHKLISAKNVLWNRSAQRKLEALLDQFKPDIAHIHNIYHQLSPSILITLKKRGIPIVLTLHDYKLICPNYELYTENALCMRCKGGKYYNAILHRCLKNSTAVSTVAALEMYLHKAMQVYERNVDCFISPSQYLAKQLTDWKEQVKRLEVIPNFVQTAAPPNTQVGQDFLYIGSLTTLKGVDLLLDNFQKNRYRSRLLLAGRGPLQANHNASNSNNQIVFLGQLDKGQLAQAVRNCRAVIVPSRLPDNFPYTVLEAMAAGKPVIGSQRGGIPEMITHRNTGWLFDPNKPEGLTAAITEAEQNDALVQQFGQNAYRKAQHDYSPQHHYEAILAVYQSL